MTYVINFFHSTNQTKRSTTWLIIYTQTQNTPLYYHYHNQMHIHLLSRMIWKTINQTKPIEICLLSNNIMDYRVVAQGKTTIPNVDDGEEFELTDVRHRLSCDPFSLCVVEDFLFVLCVQACVCPFYFSVWLLFHSFFQKGIAYLVLVSGQDMNDHNLNTLTHIIHGIQHKTFMPSHFLLFSI